MAKTKTREITIANPKGAFSILRKAGISKSDYDFTDILALRQLLTKEKSRQIGIREFALKPLDIREIAILIRQVLDEKHSS